MHKTIKLCIALSVLTALLLVAWPASAQEIIPPQMLTKITVQGNGSVSAKPDIVTVRVSASAVAEGMLEAQTAIGDIVAKATAGLESLGIAPEDIVTTGYGYYPRYNYEEDTPRLTGYQASHTLEITCRDILLLDSVITVATNSGIAEINDISYDVADKTALYRQALELAIRAAEEKAAGMAAVSGKTIVALESVTENQSFDARYAVMGAAKTENAMDTGIRSGSVSVSASVTAVYSAQ